MDYLWIILNLDCAAAVAGEIAGLGEERRTVLCRCTKAGCGSTAVH